jgi:putative methionine-R-sulfoxide reductase with GAF domain
MGDKLGFALPAALTLSDRYTIEAPISSGAMGAVYRAWDTHTDTAVAVKHVESMRHAQRFEVEARLLTQLLHPRVVQVLDYFKDERGQYLVMELVEGTDLHTLLEQEGTPGLPLEQAIEYVRQSCEALEYVHAQQIVHRDVKPHNLILGPQGITLVDFGIARLLEDQDEDEGTIGIGTPRYMAPEVFAGGGVSPRSDVFGIAATLWTLIAGAPPVYANPRTLDDLVPAVPPEIAEAVKAGLEMIPERRVASVDAFARALGARLQPAIGDSLVRSVEQPAARRGLLEAIAYTAAGVFTAAASSIALEDATTGELVYQSAWGAGAREIVGVRLGPGQGLAGSVVSSGEPLAVADAHAAPRFAARIAAGTGYVPYTMLIVPLIREGRPIGVLSLLDRRDGEPYGSGDAERATLFAELAVTVLDTQDEPLPGLGAPRSPVIGTPV